MKFNILGNTGLWVSSLGFGASPLGNEFGPVDRREGIRAVHEAVELGVNYFDVAPYYGRGLAEEVLGEALVGVRDKVVLATKACRYGSSLPDGFDFSARRVAQSVDESLKRLGTDYLDIYQVHDVEFCDRERILGETIPAMQKLKEQGKVRFIGVTGYGLDNLSRIVSVADVDTVLSYCRYDLLDCSMDSHLTPIARHSGIGLINASPFHMGVLTNETSPDWHPLQRQVLSVVKKASDWCKERGVDLAKLALQFAMAHDYVTVTLAGMSSVSQVRANVVVADSEVNKERIKEVLELLLPVRNIVWKEGIPENYDPGAVDKSRNVS